MTLPLDVEKAILEILAFHDLEWHTAKIHKKRLSQIRRQLRTLSNDFAQSIPSEEKYAEAYLAYNVPRNFMEAMIIGREVAAFTPHIRNKETINILDIGCGEGAGMLGLYYSLLNSHNFSFTGIDTSARLLRECRKLTELVLKKSDVRVSLRKHDVSDGLLPTKQKFDIVILSHSLAEMYPGSIPIRFIHRLFRKVTENGLVIIIEPALKQLSRRLADLRNSIITDRKLSVHLPCPHHQECPLYSIRKQKEWCHQSIRWQPPDFMKIINQGLNREISTLKFSYLVISRNDFSIPRDHQYLVISNLLKEKGKQKCFLCTRTGRLQLVRLNKNGTECNKVFGRIRKGDMISVENLVEKRGYWHVAPDTKIRIHHSKHF